MVPESNEGSKGFPLSERMTVKILNCYFGNGPRYWEEYGTPAPPMAEAETGTPVDDTPGDLQPEAEIKVFKPQSFGIPQGRAAEKALAREKLATEGEGA